MKIPNRDPDLSDDEKEYWTGIIDYSRDDLVNVDNIDIGLLDDDYPEFHGKSNNMTYN